MNTNGIFPPFLLSFFPSPSLSFSATPLPQSLTDGLRGSEASRHDPFQVAAPLPHLRDAIVICWEHQFPSPRGSCSTPVPRGDRRPAHHGCPRTLLVLSLGLCPHPPRYNRNYCRGDGCPPSHTNKGNNCPENKVIPDTREALFRAQRIPSPESPNSQLDSRDLLDLQWSDPKIFQRAKPCLALINEH